MYLLDLWFQIRPDRFCPSLGAYFSDTVRYLKNIRVQLAANPLDNVQFWQKTPELISKVSTRNAAGLMDLSSHDNQ